MEEENSCRAHVKNAGLSAMAETFGVLAENTMFHLKKCLNSADPSIFLDLHLKLLKLSNSTLSSSSFILILTQ